jgi:hypothetical protein
LRRGYLWEGVIEEEWSGEQLLEKIDASTADGDSRHQMAIPEIATIERCE